MYTANSFDTKVQNKVNETNLEYIGIFGLFGRYDIELPFDKQVNIFIGENGLGKTTILNCIYFVLEKKFSRLANIYFSEIKIKFRNNHKIYEISVADIREYNRNMRNPFNILADKDSYDSIIEDIILNEDDMVLNEQYIYIDDKFRRVYTDHRLEYVARKLAHEVHLPLGYAHEVVREYFEIREREPRVRRKANGDNVAQLIKAISENVTHKIIYLPTYRRIEDDLDSLNLTSEELDNAEQLIKFGMSDVQKSIERILKKIRTLAMEGFTAMTGVLLKQYTDGLDPVSDMSKNREKYPEIEEHTVKIVLDRVGKEIEQPYKMKILELINSGNIWKDKYYHLLNFINKLIDNYDLQKAYDDRIKQFSETCNRYMIDKHFNYNQSTLNLEIHLNNEKDKKKRVISLTQLSSGEKQIVSLFSKLYLENNERSIVIIDEPEVSLSLEWQKMLLPDIMRTERCDLLLTVTHSPFIFQNEFDYDAKEMRRFINNYKWG